MASTKLSLDADTSVAYTFHPNFRTSLSIAFVCLTTLVTTYLTWLLAV